MTRLSDLIDFERPDDNGAAMYRLLLTGFMLLSVASIVIVITRSHAVSSPSYMAISAIATFTLSSVGYAGLARIRRFWLLGVPGIPFSFLVHSLGIQTRTTVLLGAMFAIGAVLSIFLRGRYSTEHIGRK